MDIDSIKDMTIHIQEQQVILDKDVARLYSVETKRVNEAVKNNPDKFPEGYIIYLSDDAADSLRSKFSTLKNPRRGGHFKYSPKAFTEKALYMIARILKSPKATETTISIIETFAKVRELSRNIAELHQQEGNNTLQSMLQKSGEIIADIISSDFETIDTETTVELNLAILSVKHTIKRKSKK